MSTVVVEVYGGGMGGGAARHLAELLPALSAQGDAIWLLSLGRDDLWPDGIPVERVRGFLPAVRFLRRLRPDVVHTHGVRANFVGRLAARLAGIPSVTTVHSFLASDYGSPLRAAVAHLLDDATLPWADRVIAISHALRQDLIMRGARPEHIAVIPNGIPDPPAANPEVLKALGGGNPVLAVAARLQPTKGVDVAIRALRYLPHHHLAILGDGPALEELRRLADAELVSDRVHFLGYRDDLRAIIAGADLLLAPSRAEGFGLAALEAMAQGVPVVASRVGGLPELLSQGGGVLTPPDDPEALAQGVLEALATRDSLSQAARIAASSYTLREMARATAAVLEAARRT